MLLSLPPELLCIICNFLDRNAILNICLVCRHANTIFHEGLYRCLFSKTMPPLYRAIERARLDVAAQLLDRYPADINFDYGSNTPLLLPIDLQYPEAVNFLLQYNTVDIDCCDLGGNGILSLAIIRGSAAIVKRLLCLEGLNINYQSTDRASAIFHALRNDQLHILQLLLSDPRTNVNITNYAGRTPLHVATREGNQAAIQILAENPRVNVNCLDPNGDTPLLLAAKNVYWDRSTQVVQSLLLNRNLDINLQDIYGSSALWHAVRNGNTSLATLLLRQDHPRVNDFDRRGYTPLALSAENGSTLLVKLLLRQPGICINSGSNDALPPLWVACRAGQHDVVTLLLGQRSIDVNQKGPTGTTPIQMARINKHSRIVSVLLTQGG